MLKLITQNGVVLETADYDKARWMFDSLALDLLDEAGQSLTDIKDFVILIEMDRKLVKHARGHAESIIRAIQQEI